MKLQLSRGITPRTWLIFPLERRQWAASGSILLNTMLMVLWIDSRLGWLPKDTIRHSALDYTDTFFAVAKLNSVRILISLAVNFNWPLHQLDGTNVLLHGDLQEVVYMQQPLEFVAEGEPTKICQLRKSIYGLKQSPCTWFEKFSTILLDFGFVRCLLDYGVFDKRSKKGCIILVYVDDIVISGCGEHGIQVKRLGDCNSISLVLKC